MVKLSEKNYGDDNVDIKRRKNDTFVTVSETIYG